MNKGQAFAIAATLCVAAVTLFFNAHRYTALGFGLAALALIAFGVFSRQRVKVTGSIQTVHIMRFMDLKQQSPEYDGKNLSAFNLLMFVELASAEKPITLSNWTLAVEAGKNSYPTRLADVTRLPHEQAKRDFHDSPLRHLSKNLPADFKSLPDQALEGVDSKGRRGWLQFDVYRVDDVLTTNPINVTLTFLDSLRHVHQIRRKLTDAERADLV
jgi:hypothetical protein